jgi:hypothetical protein
LDLGLLASKAEGLALRSTETKGPDDLVLCLPEAEGQQSTEAITAEASDQPKASLNDSNPHSFMQQGQMPRQTDKELNCCLLVEDWLAWEWVASFSDFTVVGIYDMLHISPTQALKNVEINTTNFCSGQWTMVNCFWNGLQQCRVSLVLHQEHGPRWNPGWFWHCLGHSDCDGITTGGWWCGSSIPGFWGPIKIHSTRRLRHILNLLLSGEPINTQSDWDHIFATTMQRKKGFHPGGLFPC